jgi:cyclic beta-1,2-glucan synthetase
VTAPAPDHRVGILEAAAHELRALHVVSSEPPRAGSLWTRLGALAAWLGRARAVLAEPEPAAAKAAEWVLDNDYLVQRAVRQIEQDLPAGFYKRLPSLATGEAQTLPRSFSLADGLLRASRMQLSLASAVQFVRAYQDDGELTIAEVWAFPTMLRLVCLERLATALARLVPELEPPYVPTPLAAVPAALDDTECVARALANLGVIASIPWKDFFVQTNRVEAILNGDPAGVYARMDFATRDGYRKAVEELAYHGAHSEARVAEYVVEQARRATDAGVGHEHVGYWLVGPGREALERALAARPPVRVSCGRWLRRHAAPLYAARWAARPQARPVAGPLPDHNGCGPAGLGGGLVLALLPAAVVGIGLVHWLVTLLLPRACFRSWTTRPASRRSAGPRSSFPLCREPPRRPRSSSSDWKATTSPIPIAPSSTRSSRTLRTHPPSTCPATTPCSRYSSTESAA